MPIQPTLSTMLITFSADDPGGWTHLVERAKVADRAGIDRLALADHVVFGENLEAYSDAKSGGIAGGRQPTGPDGHWLEPLSTIAHLTAVTERIRFATAILIAALRRPVVLAKTLATIDVLSGGRVDLGVGVGWQREEYEAAGLDYRDRGAQLNHTLEVCQTLWSQQVAEHSSDRSAVFADTPDAETLPEQGACRSGSAAPSMRPRCVGLPVLAQAGSPGGQMPPTSLAVLPE